MRIFAFIMAIFLLSGCASATKRSYPRVETRVKSDSDRSRQLENIGDEQMAQYTQEKGVVFGKTDFLGVLQTNYVKLIFEDLHNPENKYQLYIGENEADSGSSDVKAVKPGYFFIELPEGQYRISSISIPVASTIASEEMHIIFEVEEDAITYLGTLRVNGTKEKIHLGGVPVIKPGFEYTVEIIDEQKEGFEIFRQNYPQVSNDIIVRLMQIAPSPAVAAPINK